MKTKVLTRAMAFFLAFILSFTLIIPSTFAAEDTETRDEIIVEVAGEPDAEDEISAEMEETIVIDEDEEIAADAVLEDHIREDAKDGYVDSVETMNIVNYIKVMNTLFNGDFMDAGDTIDSIMFSLEDGDGSAFNKFLSSTNTVVAVYDVNPESDYYVARVNTMMDTANVSVFDWEFALNDDSGTLVDGCHYDKSTGLAYIPKDLYIGDDGRYTIGLLQVQLGQKISGDFSDIEDSTTASVLDEDEVDVYTTLSDIFAPETSVNVEAGLNEENMTVLVNGMAVNDDIYDYDAVAGVLTLDMMSTDVGTVSVVTDEDEYGIQTFSSDLWYDEWNDRYYYIYPDNWTDVKAVNEGSELVLPNWVTVGTALMTNSLGMTHRTSSYITGNEQEWYGNASRGYQYYNSIYGTADEEGWLVSWITDWYAGKQLYVDWSSINLQMYNEYFKFYLDEGSQFTYQTTFNGSAVYNVYEGNNNPTGQVIEGFDKLGNLLGQCVHVGDAAGQADNTYYGPAMFRVVYKDSDPTTGQDFMIIGLISTQNDGQTGFGFYRVDVDWSDNGELQLKKESGNTSITDGNDLYSLEGAEYYIAYNVDAEGNLYNYATDIDGNYTTLKTGADGYTNVIEYAPGTYYIKEHSASFGYQLDVTVYKAVVESDERTTITSVEQPDNDPIGLVLTKISSDNTENPAPLTGAQFTVKYYDGYYDSMSALPSSATRTWVLETKEDDGDYIIRLSDRYKVSGDALYYDAEGQATLPLGTITIEETKAPDGYTTTGSYLRTSNNSAVADSNGVLLLQVNEDFQASGGASLEGGNYYTKADTPISGGVAVQKIDHERDINVPQGDATLAGAELTVTSNNDYDVMVNGTSYSNGQVVMTLTTDADGYAETGNHDLPYGTYTIKETKAPVGYLLNEDWSYTLHITEDGVIVEATDTPDDVMRGGVGIYKYDSETYTMMTTPQGDADLEGAEFTLYNRSAESVYVNGNWYEPDEVIMMLTTERYSDGTHNYYYAATDKDALPYGSYELIETKSSEGYLIGTVHDYTFTIDYDGDFELIDIAPSSDGNSGQFNDVIRGGVEIQKRDLESGYDTPEGGASLEGAEFTIFNESRYPVLVNGELYQPGEVVLVLYTDENGYVSVPDDTLPYGSYHVEETQAPEGYLPHDQHKENTKDDSETVGVLERDFVIRTDGEMIDLTDQTYDFNKQDYVASADAGDAIYNQVIRGDFAIRKITDDQHTMRGVIFSIESVTTGEIHYFMTDENGAYSSASEYADHSYDTNYHDDESTWNETDDEGLRHHVGMWFSGYGNDDEGALVDDSLGALPYDTYKITEIRTAANEGYTLWEDTFTVGPNDNNIIIDLNDIEDSTWDIDTVATFESTNSKYAPVSENTITIDAVSYENLTTGHEYTLVAKLYDKNTQNFVKNAYGEDVMSVTAFTPRLHFGTANTEIVFDSTGLDGHDIVVFEYVYDGDEIIGDPVLYETDPEEANQTLHFPEVQTTALDAETGTHTSLAGETITIVDTVEYSNLQPGREYTVTGTLMNKDTGEPVLTADGEEITSEATFTPDEPDGYVTVVFEFDGTGLEGVVTVVFEHVYYKGVEYAAHADINDDEQTVYIPKIHTTAWAEETGINAASAGEDITLYDTVSYKGVEPDREYHIFSVLFNAETHEAEVDADGNEIWSDTGPFTAEESEGLANVEFNIDASLMEGHRTVFYEILYQVETDEETGEVTYTLIAEEDLADVPDETIYFPDIHTNAYDSGTGAGVVEAKEDVTLIDTVTYTNLAPGHEYTVTGVLMNKETGEPILDAEGNQVTSEAAFTPDEPDGTVEVEFTFDATGLEGTTVVVFEDLYYEDIQLTTHADLEDEDQSVYIPKIHTTAIDSDTEDHISMADDRITIIDTVEYTNLQPGNAYTVTGTLMDKETGEAMLDDSGEAITAETTFVPEEADGFVDMEFTFSGVSLAGKTLVAFESVTYEDIEVAVHADIEDEDQTVYVPEIHTTAIAESTGTHEVTAEGTVTIVDTVEYTNLLPGKTYTMSGELMDEATGESLGITANTVFTPGEPDGTVDVTFMFDADDMADTTAVVFEECSIAVEDEDVPVAEHKDLTDTDQQVKLTAPPVTETPTGTPTSTDSPKTGAIFGFSVLAAAMAAAGAAVAGSLARKKKMDVKY